MKDWWQNCAGYHDGTLVTDAAVIAIDAMEERIAPLDEQASAIRGRIGRFEACYHEADKEAELIVRAIASGQAPAESGERPAQRKTELENCRDILSAWCDDASEKVAQKSVGKASAEDVATFIGKRTPLKVWQVRRIVERVEQALDPACRYHNMALDMADTGEHADARLPASLGGRTPVKRWLAGSLGKTIELQLESSWA